MEITDLPRDVFLLIVAHLSARTTILCRTVCKRWQAVFTDQDLSLQLLKWHFPRCREMRMAYAAGGGDCSGLGRSGSFDAHGAEGGSTVEKPPGGAVDDEDQTPSWTAIFTTVARRYHHLRSATPRSIEKIRLGTSGETQDRFYGVATWDRYLRLDDKTAAFHHPDPSWCYGDGGVLVYHAHPDDEGDHVAAARAHVYPWRLLDLASGEAQEVPFPHDDDRIVRRVRLADGVLAFEWCERTAYHQLNDREECHRHYVTVLDVVRARSTGLSTATNSTTSTTAAANNNNSAVWEITPRAEFKFHFLGLPLNGHDRFFSAHTRTHYAVYVWQPNRSPWGEDDPIESVLVWDLRRAPPQPVRRMAWAALAFYGLRQGATPRLRGLALDGRNLYLVEEEHRWARGAHSSLSPPRVHLVRSTGIPVVPAPAAEGRGGGGGGSCQAGTGGSDAAGDGGEGEGKGSDSGSGGGETIVQGPRWLDECGANGDVNLSFCSRTAPGDRLATSASGPAAEGIWDESLLSPSQPRSQSPPSPLRRAPPTLAPPTLARQLEAAARAPSARWPGRAPCWRHEEFPYLTVSEAVDFRAGVRVAARHCFMLETLSVHVRPSLSLSLSARKGAVDGGGGAGEGGGGGAARSIDDRVSGRLRAAAKSSGGGVAGDRKEAEEKRREEEEREEEVQFPDEMWDELLGRGFICGDERWLVGEDREGRVTIVRF